MSVLLEEPLILPLDELESEKDELLNVEDEASQDDTVIPEHYDITSYGADFDVEGLVKRMKRGDIFVPEFQRGYVWPQQMASRFIESLLLGLPVPGIFLARENKSNRLIVIDGQQRLRTLAYFYEGFFHQKADTVSRRIFKLNRVQPEFEGCTYESLTEQDRIKLNDSIIHATVVKQESPKDGDTSMYHIFERLNNGGLKIAPQEIRTAIYHGDMIDTQLATFLLRQRKPNKAHEAVFAGKVKSPNHTLRSQPHAPTDYHNFLRLRRFSQSPPA